ncbi:MAG: hypothetical protein IPL32_15680 [Chloracidobacterium sp.]|nr:hypothetical protein [Chloracidobacterium sp.]
MSMEQQQETWQIEANGQVYDTSFEELTTLIDRGDLLRMDRVRKGNLRWIEAGKVPSLLAVFNAKEGDQPAKPVITLTKLGPPVFPGQQTSKVVNALPAQAVDPMPNAEPSCSMHDDIPATYQCGTCFSNFCKTCPKSYGGTVKICPYCGAMCESLAKVEAARVESVNYAAALGNGFGFGDLINALAYPLKFKTSLVLGAVLYMFCSLGQGAAGFGSIFLIGAGLISYMLANTLVFGVLSNTVENFAQGKIGENFMPSFDDFSIWEDVVQPFFLSIGVYISSFGPLLLLMIVAFFFVTSSVSNELNSIQSDAAQTVAPQLPLAAKANQQTQTVNELLNRTKEAQKRRMEQIEKETEEAYSYDPNFMPGESSSIAPEAEAFNRQQQLANQTQNNAAGNSPENGSPPVVDDSEEMVMRANQIIQDTRKAQLEAAVGKAPDTIAKERSALLSTILGYGALFLLVGGVCLLWGLFYFPAACAVAGYTQSFAATVNPLVGLDTIKRLGLDYVKILLMCLVIVIISGIISGILGVVFFAFDMPGVGNMPAKAIGSLFGFYFAVVFSCILGFAMFKASDRLKLPS